MTQATENQHHNRIKDGIDQVRERAEHVYVDARHRASEAVDASRQRARQAADAIEANPVGLLVGGLAVGALVAAVIPRSARERELLAPLGKRVGATAAAALAAAKAAGREELDGLGLTRTAAKGQAKSLFEGVMKAATTAGKAGVEAGRDEARHR